MNPLCIAVLDRDTLADRPFDFDFPHTLSSYGSTEAHQTAERIQGADIIITNKVVISAEHIAANPQLKLITLAATNVGSRISQSRLSIAKLRYAFNDFIGCVPVIAAKL